MNKKVWDHFERHFKTETQEVARQHVIDEIYEEELQRQLTKRKK